MGASRQGVVRAIEHIGITVPDIEEASAFLEKAFGAEVIYDMKPDPGRFASRLRARFTVHPGHPAGRAMEGESDAEAGRRTKHRTLRVQRRRASASGNRKRHWHSALCGLRRRHRGGTATSDRRRRSIAGRPVAPARASNPGTETSGSTHSPHGEVSSSSSPSRHLSRTRTKHRSGAGDPRLRPALPDQEIEDDDQSYVAHQESRPSNAGRVPSLVDGNTGARHPRRTGAAPRPLHSQHPD